ncbi:membrane protein [Enterococcus florum]|uniref:Membrane protein n=1 Tax=Enterococcus florum TaxID=2480627 RepID=A0A4P5P7H1_9ENTE|nr:DUF2142 domain-containing protein [Enterococcus florum]GCF93925.1 membrane protein [Enterococcus florum]
MEKIKIENLFIALATLFIGISIAVMPINRVPDESNHARMAWGILYEQTDSSFDWMNSISQNAPINKHEYKQLFTEKIDMSHEAVRLKFGLKNIVHIPQFIGMILGSMIYPSIGLMITLGRVFNGLFYIMGMYLIIKHSKYGKLPLSFISLLPIMIQQAASLSYDVANYLAITAFFAWISNLSVSKQITKRTIVQFIVMFFALYATKINNLLLFLLLLTLGLRFSGILEGVNPFIEKTKAFVLKYRYLLLTIVLFLGLATVLVINQLIDVKHFTRVMINTLFSNNLNEHLNTILTIGMFGYFGNFAIQLPLWLIFADVAFLTLLFTLETEIEINKFFGVISGVMVPFQIAAIIAGMYFAWTPVVLGTNANISVGAQGRYFTPFLIYFVPLFLSFKNKLVLRYDRSFVKIIFTALCLFNFLVMMLLVIPYYW